MATKYKVGDVVILDMTGVWSFDEYTGTSAVIKEIDASDTNCPYLVTAYNGKIMWLSEKHIVRRKRNAK